MALVSDWGEGHTVSCVTKLAKVGGKEVPEVVQKVLNLENLSRPCIKCQFRKGLKGGGALASDWGKSSSPLVYTYVD